MPKQKYNIALTLKEQKKLKAIVSKGVSPARTIRRANLLLKYAVCGNDNITQLLPFELFSKKFCLKISELGLEIV